MAKKYLCFSLEGILFAVPVEHVQEITQAPAGITQIPAMPEHIRGITKFRNQVLQVIDLKKRLDICHTEDFKKMIIINNGHNIGVLVDEVIGMVLLEPEEIDKTLALHVFLENPYIKGIANHDNRLICVLSEEIFENTPQEEKNIAATFLS